MDIFFVCHFTWIRFLLLRFGLLCSPEDDEASRRVDGSWNHPRSGRRVDALVYPYSRTMSTRFSPLPLAFEIQSMSLL